MFPGEFAAEGEEFVQQLLAMIKDPHVLLFLARAHASHRRYSAEGYPALATLDCSVQRRYGGKQLGFDITDLIIIFGVHMRISVFPLFKLQPVFALTPSRSQAPTAKFLQTSRNWPR